MTSPMVRLTVEHTMDNKYGLGSTKVATHHHETHHKSPEPELTCKYCGGHHLMMSQSLHDHRCADCGKWQEDVEMSYSTGRASDY